MDLIKDLIKYAALKEDLDIQGTEYTVYKAEGKYGPEVYYGYVKGVTEEDMVRAFQTERMSTEADAKRGVNQMLKINGGVEGISFEPLMSTDTQEHALAERNKLRMDDPASITGPSAFPGGHEVYRRSKEQHPDIHAHIQWKRQEKSMPKIMKKIHAVQNASAMNAYARGFFDPVQWTVLKQSPEVLKDLKSMKADDFINKYHVKLVDSNK